MGFIPKRSPFGLIQEDLIHSEWLLLVACMMLNMTSRKQVDRVLPEFMKKWPGPREFLDADNSDVAELCKSLGLANRRTQSLKKMTLAYASSPWQQADELPGIGQYAAASHEIFCRGNMPIEAPKDHALAQYFAWRVYEERKEDHRKQ